MAAKITYCPFNRLFLLIITFISGSAFSLFAQQSTIQSLEQRLRKPITDAEKIETLFKLVFIYQHFNDDSTLTKANYAFELAQKKENSKYRCEALNWLGTAFVATNEYEKALRCFNDALRCSKAENNLKALASAYNNLGVYLAEKSRYKEALKYYQKSLKVREKVGDSIGMSANYNNMGNVKLRMGDYTGAILDIENSIAIKKAIKDSATICVSYTNLANIYLYTAEKNLAKHYLEMASKWVESSGDVTQKSELYNQLGVYYYSLEIYPISLKYFEKSLELSRMGKNPFQICLALNNSAELYYILKNYVKAEALLLETKSLSKGDGYLEFLIQANTILAKVYLETNPLKSIAVCKENMQLLRKYPHDPIELETFQTIAEAYKKNKQYELAIQFLHAFYEKKSKADLAASKEELDKQKIENKINKQQLEIAELEKKQQENNNILLRNKIILTLLGLVLFAAVIFIFYLVKNRRERNKATELISKQAYELSIKANELEKLNQVKDRMFSILSHDLKNPLSNLQQTLFLLDEDLIDKDEFKIVKGSLIDKFTSINLLLENLLTWSKESISKNPIHKRSPIDLNQCLEENIQLMNGQAIAKGILISSQFTNNIKVMAELNQLNLIVRNILANAIKFSPENSSILVQTSQENGHGFFCITDKGKGMSQEELNSILNGEIQNPQIGTKGERGSGIGLSLVNEFIKANFGKILINSSPGKGTSFRVGFEQAGE